MAKAPTTRLKIAPVSKPSITPTPVAKPASIVNTNVRRRVDAINAASARNTAAVPITHMDKPHAATEKRSPFNAAAMPPTVHTHGANPHCRKNTHAAQPSRNSDSGAKTFAIITGPSTVATKFEGVGAEDTLSAPTQFKSFQTPNTPPATDHTQRYSLRGGRRWRRRCIPAGNF